VKIGAFHTDNQDGGCSGNASPRIPRCILFRDAELVLSEHRVQTLVAIALIDLITLAGVCFVNGAELSIHEVSSAPAKILLLTENAIT